jgi:hypothetical protein
MLRNAHALAGKEMAEPEEKCREKDRWFWERICRKSEETLHYIEKDI